MGQVGGADGRLVGPYAKVDHDRYLFAGQVHLAGTWRTDSVDAHRGPVERHADPVRLEDDGCHADRGQNPAPVGGGPEQGGLHQTGARDDAGCDDGLVLGGGPRHGDGYPFGETLGVRLLLRAQVVAHRE